MAWSLGELAARLGAEVTNGDPAMRIQGVANPEEAGAGDLVFLVEAKYAAAVRESRAAAVVACSPLAGKPTLVVKAPRVAMAQALALFEARPPAPGVDPTAVVHPTASLGAEVSIGPCAVVGPGVVLGNRVRLHPGVVLGGHVTVGDDCLLYPNVVVRENCRVGARVIVQPGAVIGSDGYGFVTLGDKTHLKMPQIGVVVVEDDVEIGANVTIDRATIGETVIGRGTKIDNLAHVGHNVRVGEHVLIVSQVGISGSTTVGNRVTLAGQVGVAGHLSIGDDTVVAGKAGVTKSLPPRMMASGFPARPHREELRRQAMLDQVGGLMAEVRALRAEVEALRTASR